MREDQVVNGVSFLTHPKVQAAPLEERMGFLRNKGLTQEEIDEAVKRADATGEQTPSPPVIVPPPPPHHPPPSWASSWLVPGTLALSAGAGMTFLYKQMVLKNEGVTPWQQLQQNFDHPPQSPSRSRSLPGAPGAVDALEAMGRTVPTLQNMSEMKKQDESNDDTLSNMFGQANYNVDKVSTPATSDSKLLALIENQTEILQDIGKAMRDLNDQVKKPATDVSVAVLTQQTADLKAELNSLKSLLIANHVKGGGDLSALVTNGTPVVAKSHVDTLDSLMAKTAIESKEDPKQDDSEIEQEKMASSRELLQKLCKDCPEEKLLPAVNLLLMYLKNLANDPGLPRYGRISRSNTSYANALNDCPHHMDLLKANGFEEKAGAYGGGSRSSMLEWSEEWRTNKDKWAITVLKDTIKNLETVQSTRKQKSANEQNIPKPSSDDIRRPLVADPVPNGKTAFVAPPFSNEVVKQPMADDVVSGPTDQDISIFNSGNDSAVEESTFEESPLSYEEVVNMMKEGKSDQIPGIKKIPNTLSVDYDVPLVSASPSIRKPWENEDTRSESEDTYMPSILHADISGGVEIQEIED